MQLKNLFKMPLTWKRFLLLWVAGLFVLSIVGWVTLYGWLNAYEKCRSESTMDRLMESTSAEAWASYAKESVISSASAYDDVDDLLAEYTDAFLQDASFTYMKDALNSTDETRYYTIRAGRTPICRVTLTQEERSSGFGLHAWKLADITPVDMSSGIRPAHVEITAPAGKNIYINGKLLSDSYITDSDVAYPDMTAAESRGNPVAHAVKYVVDPIYGSVVVSDESGAEIAPEQVADGNAYYCIEPEDYSVTVIAPDTATVYLNGTALTAAECTGNKDELFVGLERYTDNGQSHLAVYELSPLYAEPTLTAVTADGVTLQPKQDALGNIGFFPEIDEETLETWEQAVAEYFKRYVTYCTSRFNKAKYNSVLRYTLRDSSLYKYIRSAYWVMDWNSNSKVNYTELTYGDFRQISDTCFTCTIRYAADLASSTHQGVIESSLSNTYELVFTKRGKLWLAAYMSAEGDSQ